MLTAQLASFGPSEAAQPSHQQAAAPAPAAHLIRVRQTARSADLENLLTRAELSGGRRRFTGELPTNFGAFA